MHKNLNEFEFLPDPTTAELSALECQKKLTYYLVATRAPSFLIGSSSFFHVTMKTIMSGWLVD